MLVSSWYFWIFIAIGYKEIWLNCVRWTLGGFCWKFSMTSFNYLFHQCAVNHHHIRLNYLIKINRLCIIIIVIGWLSLNLKVVSHFSSTNLTTRYAVICMSCTCLLIVVCVHVGVLCVYNQINRIIHFQHPNLTYITTRQSLDE